MKSSLELPNRTFISLSNPPKKEFHITSFSGAPLYPLNWNNAECWLCKGRWRCDYTTSRQPVSMKLLHRSDQGEAAGRQMDGRVEETSGPAFFFPRWFSAGVLPDKSLSPYWRNAATRANLPQRKLPNDFRTSIKIWQMQRKLTESPITSWPLTFSIKITTLSQTCKVTDSRRT